MIFALKELGEPLNRSIFTAILQRVGIMDFLR